MRSSLRRLLLVALLLSVVAVLLYRFRGTIHLQDFSWDRLWHSVRQARGWLLLLSVAAIFVSYAIRALRWVRFSRYLGRIHLASVYNSTLVGFTAVFLLGRAGEPVRPLLIARRGRLPVSSTFGIYVLERVFDTASTAVIAGIGLLAYDRMDLPAGASAVWEARARATGLALLIGLLVVIGLLLYFRLHGAGAMERRLAGWRMASGWRHRVAHLLAGFSEGLQAIRTLPDLLAAVGYSAAHWALVALIYLWVAHSFGGRFASLDYPGAMLVLAFTMVGSALQFPGVGGGSQAASFIAFTVVFGVEKEPAAAASIVLWLVTFAASSLAGVPLLIHEGWSMGELRRLARTESEADAMRPAMPQGSAKPGDIPR